jgi:hypothetical protein
VGDWANTQDKVVPGKKSYLFVGSAGNAIDSLIRQATAGIDYVTTVRPPLEADILNMVSGVLDDTQTLVVRGIEDLKESDWVRLYTFMLHKKIKGTSIILAGRDFPETVTSKEVKAAVVRQGVFVDVTSPTGHVGRRSLAQWVGENWKITQDLATQVCERVSYSVEKIVWATTVFLRLSGGKPMVGHNAKMLAFVATPVEPVEDAYRLVLSKNRQAALEVVSQFNVEHNLAFFRLLEAALTDLSLLHKVITNGNFSTKTIADKSGLHIVRVLDLIDLAPRYSPTAVQQCRQALQLGLENANQKEAAYVVVSVWG